MHEPELVESFKFPHQDFHIPEVPKKEELQSFYKALKNPRERAIFLMLSTTGLRKSEVRELKLTNMNFEKRMILLNKRGSKTKNTWVSFFNGESKVLSRNTWYRDRYYEGEKLFPTSQETFCAMWRGHFSRLIESVRVPSYSWGTAFR